MHRFQGRIQKYGLGGVGMGSRPIPCFPLPSLFRPLPSLSPQFPPPPFPFLSLTLPVPSPSLSLEVGPLIQLGMGSAVSSPSGVRPKLNLVHFSLKI